MKESKMGDIEEQGHEQLCMPASQYRGVTLVKLPE